MLSKNFDVLTPLSKLHRISRTILNRGSFTTEPGIWVALASATAPKYVEGSVVEVGNSDATKVYELSMNYSAPADDINPTGVGAYESNDAKVGRITTLSEPGVRLIMGDGLLTAATSIAGLSIGDKLVVSALGDDDDGKLMPVPTAAGDYVQVVKVTGISGTTIEVQTIEPLVVTVT
jgi:hypothetical protein